jgi:hypothetical protein
MSRAVDPRPDSVTAMTDDYTGEPASPTTPLPTQTLLIGAEAFGKRIGSIDYTPAEPGETIRLGPPLWAPGTEATVVSSRTRDGDDGKPLHVLEVTRLRTLGNDVGQP